MAQHNSTQQGFSLTELMIVVAIVAILGAIGLPSYSKYAREAKRTDAHNAITTIANLEEKFFTENNTYTNDLAAVGFVGPPPPPPQLTANSSDGYWQLSIPAASATGYTIRAVPTGTHTDPSCLVIELNALGAKFGGQAAGVTPTECW